MLLTNRRPVGRSQVERLAGLDGDIGLRIFTQHSIGHGVQRIASRAHVGQLEVAVGIGVATELVVLRVLLPVDQAFRRPRRGRWLRLPRNLRRPARGGKAHLRLGLASTTTRQFNVSVNGQALPPVDHLTPDSAIGRNGIHGIWSERDVAFDASLLKAGTNTITLTVPAGTLTAGIIYDYLRLELE